ncbi:WD40-repeat-containing domain protein [Suillus subaureus]|uniref:WD40-repeat-containing domain protein n=1 Tax=Suillus subaureus TaxID=48587 RepID=A0A9P7JEY6_9AGAM|nr:WD40-repeat-containing domain protein [Suillus subaureus]KAG1818671.1 WD40-repeat-containing domain protein [Suillus subaureus]
MAARFFARRTRKEASTPAQLEEPVLKHEFEGHNDAIWGFVFLHDNIHIVSGSLDGTMRKWNCDTGLVVGEPWKSEGGGIYALALSPDGKIIACGREDGSVQLWNTDREKIEGVWTGHSRAVRSLSWSPSGNQLASGSEDGTILIQNVESGKVELGPIETVTKQDSEGVQSLAYSPSGDRLASGGFNTICIWDTKTGEHVIDPIEGLGLFVTSLVWLSDSTKLYSASDEFARVFDSDTGELLHRFEHDHSLWSIALSPKHNVLACVGIRGVVQLWDTESHQKIGQSFHQEHHQWHFCVSFSRDGRYVAYGGDDNKLTLWMVKDITKGLPPKHNFEGHARAIRDFVFLHDNIHIVTGSEDGTMRKWNYDTGLLVGKPWSGVGGSIYALALSPDGKTIACGRADGSVQRWNTDGNMMLEGARRGHIHSDWVRSLSWSPNGGHIASGSDDGTILIRKATSGIVEFGPIKTKQYRVCALAYSPSGNRIASGGWNTTICIWDSKTGDLALGLIQGLGYEVTSVVWSSDSTKLYSASDKLARVFDSTSGALLHYFQHDDILYSIALSPTYNVLVCVGDQGIAQLWDTESYQLLGQPFNQNRQILRCASFSRDGRYLACGGHDRTLAMWIVNDIVSPLIANIKSSWGDRVTDEGHNDLYDSCLWVNFMFVMQEH